MGVGVEVAVWVPAIGGEAAADSRTGGDTEGIGEIESL